MKNIKIFLLVSFILGLVFFQVKFVTEKDNLIMKADIGISKQANAEINPGGVYKEHLQTQSCGYQYIEYLEYWGPDEWGHYVKLGADVWIENVFQEPGYNGWYLFTVHTSTSTEIVGSKRTCEGGFQSCTPADCIL